MDLLFRIPYLPSTPSVEAPAVLVCVLLEHQSAPDPRMPLRTLIAAVLYWEREWKAWEDRHPSGEPLRLSPVLPIVFHTGPDPWRSTRELAELIEGPEELHTFAPPWQPLFWDLAQHTPHEWLNTRGEWTRALAVVRAERESAETFRQVLVEVLRRLEGLSDREQVRWHDLVRFVLSWGIRRRPSCERAQLLEAARTSQADVAHREEVRTMSETLEQTWEEEVFARGTDYGQLLARREDLRTLLEEAFGTVPDELVRKIEEMEDLEGLKRAIRQVVHLTTLDELEL